MAPPTGPSPVTAPPQEGVQAQATRMLQGVVKDLVDIVTMMKGDLNSPVAKSVLSALKSLAPHTPDVAEGLGQAEALSRMARASSVRPGQPSMLGIPRPRPQAPMMGMG